jgi:hypothetical protein
MAVLFMMVSLPCMAQYELGSPIFQGDWCQRIQQAISYANTAGLATVHLSSELLPINPRNPTPQQMCSVPPFVNMGSVTGMLVDAPVGAIFQQPGGQIQIPAKVRLKGLGNLSGIMTNSTFVACNTAQTQYGPQPCGSSFVTYANTTSSANSNGVAIIQVDRNPGLKVGEAVIGEGNASADLNGVGVVVAVSPSSFNVGYNGTSRVSGKRVVPITSVTSSCINWSQAGQKPYNDWAPNTTYPTSSTSTIILPLTSNAGGFLYQLQGGKGGTSRATPPAWNQTIGSTTVDYQNNWTNIGQYCIATVTLNAQHGFIEGGFPLTFTGTNTALDNAQYAYTISPGADPNAFTVMYLGGPITLSNQGSVTLQSMITIPPIIIGDGITTSTTPNGVSLGARAEYVTFDSNDLPLSLGVLGATINEGGGIIESVIRNATRVGYGVFKTRTGVPANWADRSLQIYMSGTNSPANDPTPSNSIPAVGYAISVGGNPLHSVRDITVRPNFNSNPVMDGFRVAGLIGGTFDGIHCEIEWACFHFTGSSESKDIVLLNITPGHGQVTPSGAGLFYSQIVNDAGAANEFTAMGVASRQTPYAIDDLPGKHSAQSGGGIRGDCAMYVLNYGYAQPYCNQYQFSGEFAIGQHLSLYSKDLYFRDTIGNGSTFLGQIGLMGSNNVGIDGVNGTIYFNPYGGLNHSSTSRVYIDSGGLHICNSAGSSCAYLDSNNTTAHLIFGQSGTAAVTSQLPTAGTMTLYGGTNFHVFATPYAVPPNCSYGASVTGNTYKISATTTQVTITSSQSNDGSTVSWTCSATVN